MTIFCVTNNDGDWIYGAYVTQVLADLVIARLVEKYPDSAGQWWVQPMTVQYEVI